MSFWVERCKSEYLSDVIRINEVSIPEHYEQTFWEETLAKFPEGFLVAKSNNVILGYIICRVDNTTYRDANIVSKVGMIISVAVLPQYRRKGIAEKLLNEAMLAMIDRDCNAVTLQVRVSNVAAQRLYAKYGFKLSERAHAYYANKEDALVLFKPLVRPTQAMGLEHNLGT